MNSAKKAAAYVIGIKAAADRSSESCLTHLWGNRSMPADCPCGGGCIRAQSKIFCNGCESKLLTATLQGAADGDADVRAAPDDSAALMGMRRYARDLPGPAAGRRELQVVIHSSPRPAGTRTIRILSTGERHHQAKPRRQGRWGKNTAKAGLCVSFTSIHNPASVRASKRNLTFRRSAFDAAVVRLFASLRTPQLLCAPSVLQDRRTRGTSLLEPLRRN